MEDVNAGAETDTLAIPDYEPEYESVAINVVDYRLASCMQLAEALDEQERPTTHREKHNSVLVRGSIHPSGSR